MEKTEARRQIREALDLVTDEERAAWSAVMCGHIMGLPEFGESETIMLFASLPDEFDTMPLIAAALEAGRAVYMPVVDWRRRRLRIRRLMRVGDLREGYMGILEPPEGEAIEPERLDFILVPAVGFDRMGHRLGRGGGYYDRLLSTPGLKAVKCGAALECQVLDYIPHGSHDVPVDMLVTEGGVYRFET